MSLASFLHGTTTWTISSPTTVNSAFAVDSFTVKGQHLLHSLCGSVSQDRFTSSCRFQIEHYSWFFWPIHGRSLYLFSVSVSAEVTSRSCSTAQTLSKLVFTSARYSSEFVSYILPTGTSSVKEGPYNGNPEWEGSSEILVETWIGFPSWFGTPSAKIWRKGEVGLQSRTLDGSKLVLHSVNGTLHHPGTAFYSHSSYWLYVKRTTLKTLPPRHLIPNWISCIWDPQQGHPHHIGLQCK